MPPTTPEEISRWDLGWKALLRYDQYISATNTKAGFILALNGGVLTLLFNWLCIGPKTGTQWLLDIWPVATATLTFAIVAVILITLMVVSPKLWSPKNQKVTHSMIFFGSVARQRCEDFLNLVKNADADLLIDDLFIQVHTVGSLLSDKFTLMKFAFRVLIYLQMPIFLSMTAIKILTK